MRQILVIDDDELFLSTLERVLKKQGFSVKTAKSGYDAVELAKEEHFDLIISDVRMPGMDGIETLTRIKSSAPRARAIVITGYASDTAPIQAIKLGADDYINKPFHMEEFIDSILRSLSRCDESLSATTARNEMESKYHNLIENIIHSIEKDHLHFHGHASKVSELAIRMGRAKGLSGERLEILRKAAIFHDIGMLQIRETIIEKSEQLEKSEREKIRETPIVARNLLKDIEGLRPVLPVVYHIHENYDGSGYPDGIGREDIPLEARILAVAESYVSLTSKRAYREEKERPDALSIIKNEENSRFDPDIVAALCRVLDEDEQTPAEGDKNKMRNFKTLIALGELYLNMGDFELSHSALDTILENFERISDPSIVIEALLLKSRIELGRSQSEKAIETATRAIKQAKKYGDQLLIAKAFLQMGVVFRDMEKWGEAESAMQKAMATFGKWGDAFEKCKAGMHISLLYQRLSMGDESYREPFIANLTNVLEEISTLGLEGLLEMEGISFLPLYLEALNRNIHPEMLKVTLKKVISRSPSEAIPAFLQGEELHQRFLLDALPDIGGKEAEAALEQLTHSSGTEIGRQARITLGKISKDERPLLEIHLLGHFSLFLAGRPVEEQLWQTKHARNLFIYLSLNKNKSFSEDKLMDIFWPDSPPLKAKQNLQTTLTRVRNVFRKHFDETRGEEYVVKNQEFYQFNRDANCIIDIEEFERAIEAGIEFEARADFQKAALEYQKADRVYAGALLDGFYDDWSLSRREELQEKHLMALGKIASYHLEKESFEASLRYSRLIIEEDPFDPRGMVCLMKSLTKMGKRDSAVKKYHEYRKKIEHELGLSPDPEVVKFYYEIIDSAV